MWTAVVILVLAGLLVTGCQRIAGGEEEEFTFGVILVGPYNDHGWSEAHYEAARYVEENVPNTEMIYLDKLNPSDREGTTLVQVVDDMVSQGAELIFTTSDDFAAATDEAAAKYPDIKFVHISGDHVKTDKAPKNVRNYMGKMYYMKAVAGCAAALKTETGEIGYLGPLINDETRRLAAAAYLGCRDCYERYRDGDPDDLRFTVTWIGYWFNIPGVTLDPTEVSNDMVNSGVDVILSGIDTTEAIVVAGQRYERGEEVWAVPYDYVGACDVKPEVCLGVPYFNWGPGYVEYVKDARKGDWEHDWEWEGPHWKDINDHDKTAVGYKFGPALTEDEQATLEEYISDLGKDNVKLFEGPLYLQDGTQYLEAGEEATEEEIWYLPQLLRGMEGASF
jgi:simple sugar transport system substrate-binding protein